MIIDWKPKYSSRFFLPTQGDENGRAPFVTIVPGRNTGKMLAAAVEGSTLAVHHFRKDPDAILRLLHKDPRMARKVELKMAVIEGEPPEETDEAPEERDDEPSPWRSDDKNADLEDALASRGLEVTPGSMTKAELVGLLEEHDAEATEGEATEGDAS